MAALGQVATDEIMYRIRELIDPATPWHRALWGVSSIVALKEVVEATNARWEGTLTGDGALADFKEHALERIARDLGIGAQATRKKITEVVGTIKPKPDSSSRAALAELEQLIHRADRNYLWRWSEALGQEHIDAHMVEVTARSISSHLLDSGLHPKHLLGWIHSRRKESLASLLADGSNMLKAGDETYRFAVAFYKVPSSARRSLLKDRGLAVTDFKEKYEASENRGSFPALKSEPVAAIELDFAARDPFTALEKLREWLSRFAVRVGIGLGKDGVEVISEIVDLDSSKIRRIPPARTLKIPAIARRQIYADISESPITIQIDDALALLGPHVQAASGISVAGLWAACEALLGRVQSNGPEVADRLSDIVACTFPRHDLFDLSLRWAREGDGSLRTAIEAESSNYGKIVLMADFIKEHGDPGFNDVTDRFAVARVREMLSEPADYVLRIRGYLNASFRRLYYQRNLIMHAARFDSVSIDATARVSPALVAAAVDQIVNARFQRPATDPLGLAARASSELSLLGTSGAKHVGTLLGA